MKSVFPKQEVEMAYRKANQRQCGSVMIIENVLSSLVLFGVVVHVCTPG